MKTKNKYLILYLGSLSIVLIYLILNAPINEEIILIKFTAGENMGFNLNPGELNFGKIIPGSFATRNVTITNNYIIPTITKIKSSGVISKYIIVSENNFVLQPNETKIITFSCYPENNIELKEYTGTITITTSKF